MTPEVLVLLGLGVALFVGMLVLVEVGRRYGRRRLAEDPDGARSGTGAVEAAVFALLGLLLAFQIAGASGRLEARRQLAVREANAIRTAYLRLDLLPAEQQPSLRDLFRRYVDARLRALEAITDRAAHETEVAAANKLQGEIWAQVVAASKQTAGAGPPPPLLITALNEMIDVTTTRAMVGRTHAPVPVAALLYGLALLSALLAGYGMSAGRTRNWLHIVLFAAVIAVTVYVIFDLEFPRLGLIRVGAADQALYDVRRGMD